jgi:tetratricopeptide (TPR) repeat protein
MRWLQTEYILKGLFVGLLLVAALQQGMSPQSYPTGLLAVNLGMLGGLGIGLLVGAILKLSQGYRPRDLFGFLLFVLLECPTLVYLGILAGLVGGVSWLLWDASAEMQNHSRLIIAGGAVLGLLMGALKEVRDRTQRIGIILAMAAGLVGGALYVLTTGRLEITDQGKALLAIQILLGLPFFYLLTFAGQEEESEVEIGLICAGLGIALWLLAQHFDLRGLQMAALIVPAVLYLFYTLRILPGLRVAKHAFRGFSYFRVGRYRLALLAFRRALQLDPANSMARDGFWEVHKALDLDVLAKDPQLLELVDFDLCLERAGSLLVNGRPGPRQLEEALRLLELVIGQRPQLRPAYDYWHAVASTHQGNLDDACERLTRIIDPQVYGATNNSRLRTLMPAWQLALMLHPTLKQRVGDVQLAIPCRRMEAIAAVERVLAETPEDPGARQLKLTLYRELRLEEYSAAQHEGNPVKEFDHEFARKLGMGLIGDAENWPRGMEFLRMAVRGQSHLAVGLYTEMAKALDRAEKPDEARAYYEKARDAGRQLGVKNLAESEQQVYFRVVKYLGELAAHNGETDKAIENYKLYTESPSSGIETLRILAELYEKKGDILSAIKATDHGLVYNGQDKDLLEKKDRYYYSLPPEVLRDRLEYVKQSFDTAYCIQKAKTILEGPLAQSPDWLDVARHLSELASIVAPGNIASKLVQAKISLRYGERDRAIAVLEDARANKPKSWLSGDEEDAWYVAQQMLGDLFMEIDRPDAAIPCYQDFLKSHRAGAKTYLKIGLAWEKLGEKAKAIKAFKQVTAYDGNPLSSEAYDALHRLGA